MTSAESHTGLLIYWLYHDETSAVVHIAHTEQGSLAGESVGQELRVRHVSWLAAHGRCGSCGADIHDLSAPCPAGCVPPLGGHVRIKVPSEDWQPFREMLAKMAESLRKQKRLQRLREVADTLTDAEVTLLQKWQDGMCYYCAEPFESGNAGPIFHRDHYAALVDGGGTTIANTVLACPRCNSRKGKMHGAEYSRLVAPERKLEYREVHASMRRRFRNRLAAYLRRQAPG